MCLFSTLRWLSFSLIIALFSATFLISNSDPEPTDEILYNTKQSDIEKPKTSYPAQPKKEKTKPQPVVKSKPKAMVKPTPPKVVKSKPKPKPLANSGFVFHSDFGKYPVGHLMTNWGEGLAIKTDGYSKFLTSQYPSEHHSMTIPINFPTNWRLYIDVGLDLWVLTSINLFGDSGNRLSINCSYRAGYATMDITFPGNRTITTPFFMIKRERYVIDITLIDGVLKFVMQNQHIYSGKFANDYSFTELQITWRDYKGTPRRNIKRHDFYNINVRKMKGNLTNSSSSNSSNSEPTGSEPTAFLSPPTTAKKTHTHLNNTPSELEEQRVLKVYFNYYGIKPIPISEEPGYYMVKKQKYHWGELKSKTDLKPKLKLR